ncbi:MAG: glycerol-3-phosphate dehydrogenase/oxidase [bacterium]
MDRAERLRRLERGVDLLVIGGGITGAGVALDAASRGFRVGLVEQGDFAGGTSSRSTKLVHGGIRYLPQGHLALVRDALRERARLLRLAPHLVRPLPFLLPLYAGQSRPLGLRLPAAVRPLTPLGIRAGLIAYDVFARSPTLRHRVVTRAWVEREAPDVRTNTLRAAFIYTDARTDDVRLTHAVLATARVHGAVTLNHARVGDLLHNGARLAGARVEDRLTGRLIEVSARFVVNATGIWAQQVAEMDGPPPFHLRHSVGTHLVLRPGALRTSLAVVISETDDGRIAFIVPWADRFLLGTTDLPYSGDLAAPAPRPEEAAYLLDHANRYLRQPLGPGDVTAAFAGVRPLVAAAEDSTAAMARDHRVAVSPGGLISIVGGKLTTYRKMAEDTLNAVVTRDGTRRPCPTAAIRLVGGSGLAEARAALARAALASDQREHLLDTYGSAALDVLALITDDPSLGRRLADGLAVTAAEVVYACRAEQAVSLPDCLYLRTKLAWLDTAAADRAVEAIGSLMGAELGWDAAERRRQEKMYEERRRPHQFTI